MYIYTSLFYIPGRNAFIGIGFADRGDAFDLNVALQDHFKLVFSSFWFNHIKFLLNTQKIIGNRLPLNIT